MVTVIDYSQEPEPLLNCFQAQLAQSVTKAIPRTAPSETDLAFFCKMLVKPTNSHAILTHLIFLFLDYKGPAWPLAAASSRAPARQKKKVV